MERVTCFICGRNFSVIIIRRHEDVCYSHWRKNNLQLPLVYQKATPEKPTGVNFCSREGDSHYNNAAKASSLKCRLPQFVLKPSVRISIAGGSAKIKQIAHNPPEHVDVPHMKGHRSRLFPRMYCSKARSTLSPMTVPKPSSRNEHFLNSFEVCYRAQGWTSDLIRDPCTYIGTPTEFLQAGRDDMNPNQFVDIPILDKRNFPVDKTLIKYDQNYDVYARIHFPWEKTKCNRKF